VKCEEVYLHQYQTFEEAQARLQTFLEDVYNAKRLHSSLDNVPPDECELKYAMCSRLSGLDFLGALQTLFCQFGCEVRNIVLRYRSHEKDEHYERFNFLLRRRFKRHFLDPADYLMPC
jgi:hypothetical protein